MPATMKSRGTSKSAVSRRFVAKTAAQLTAWQTASLEGLDLVGLLIDGVHSDRFEQRPTPVWPGEPEHVAFLFALAHGATDLAFSGHLSQGGRATLIRRMRKLSRLVSHLKRTSGPRSRF